MPPPELGTRLLRIAEQMIHFRRPEITWVDLNQHFPGCLLDALFIQPCSVPDDIAADACEGPLHEFAHGMALARSEHVIVGLFLLQNEPHAAHEITGVPPVASRVEISQKQLSLHAML